MNKDFLYSDLFKLLPQAFKVTKLEFSEQGKTPAYSSDTNNNGCLGYVDKEPLYIVTKDCPAYLVFGDHTKTMNIVRRSFCVMDNVKVLMPKIKMSDNILLFITTVWKKSIPDLGYARHWSVAKIAKISLPVIQNSDLNHEYTIDDIDWQHMEDRIKELEEDRIKELDAYLKAANLDNYELTEEDKKTLSLYKKSVLNKNGSLGRDNRNEAITFKEFNVGASYNMRGQTICVDKDGIFDIIPTKKKINAIDIKFNGKHPYVARGEGENGIRGYINCDEAYLNEGNTISFGQDTATVNYQAKRYFTGDKIQVFNLNKKYGNLTERKATYLIGSMEKVFSGFLWGQQSYALDVISNIKITLPVTPNGEPDFDFMERYIRAIEKLTIADVVKYKDKVIATTKKLVK